MMKSPRDDAAAEARVYADQVATVYRLAPPNLAASVIGAGFIWWVLDTGMPGWLLTAWFGGHLAVAAARFALVLAYRRARDRSRTKVWAGCFVAGALCTGTMWGLIGTPLFPLHDSQFQLIVIGVLVAVAASGLAALSPLPRAFAALLVPSQLPFALAMLTLGTPETLLIGVAGSIYFVLMLVNASRIHRAILENITHQIELAELKQVSQERDEVEQINQQLKLEIESRKQAEQAARERQFRLDLMVEHTPIACVAWKPDYTIVSWNPAAERIFGFKQAEVIGLSAFDVFMSPDLKPQVDEFWRTYKDRGGKSQHGLLRSVTRDGGNVLCDWYNTPLFDSAGRITEIMSLAVDVTERHHAKHELMEAKEAAEAANLAKSQFLANMSHEIRTPMNGVLGMAELLEDSDLTDIQRRYVHTLSTSGEALLHIINDILDFSKIEAGKMELEAVDFDVRAISRDVIELLANRAHAKGCEMHCRIDDDVPAIVCGDPGRLRQVLMNLIGNAVKFTARGEVAIAVRCAPKADARAAEEGCVLHFAIRDTGIGIAPEARQRLFRAFTQADGSNSRQFGGTGLGLVISKQLIEMMGGDIDIQSAPGKGSTFTFTARFALAGNAAAPAAPADLHHCIADATQSTQTGALPPRAVEVPAPAAAPRVLLVEDNRVNQEVCKAMLRKLGYEVDIADNGRIGLEAAFSRQYGIVLMDCQMPEMDGFEATAAIRARETQLDSETDNSGLPPRRLSIVALTANAMPGDRERCLAAGMDDYLAKPYNKTQLDAIVGRWIRGSELPERAQAA